MNLKRLYEILNETTIQLRKGEVFEGTPELVAQAKANDGKPLTGGGVLEIYDMPHISEAVPNIDKVDLEFIVIGIDKTAAERHKTELIEILKTYPHPERLAGGPSYIEVGGEIGDQGAAFQLFALGKVLRLWDVITPATMGLTGDDALRAAGNGFIMITGFSP